MSERISLETWYQFQSSDWPEIFSADAIMAQRQGVKRPSKYDFSETNGIIRNLADSEETRMLYEIGVIGFVKTPDDLEKPEDEVEYLAAYEVDSVLSEFASRAIRGAHPARLTNRGKRMILKMDNVVISDNEFDAWQEQQHSETDQMLAELEAEFGV
jgi:hypothetical protein